VNALVNLPLPVRVAGVFVLGLAAGAAVNWAIYALCWNARPISPWSRPSPTAPPRMWSDRLPVIGWLGLARESPVHGHWFWLRPPLVELALAVGLAALYWWEAERLGLIGPKAPAPPGVVLAMAHLQFLAHALLIVLMTAATFIDFDEKTIPDSITIPGTLLGLALAIGLPESHLPVIVPPPAGPLLGNLTFASPMPFPAWPNTWLGPALASLGFCAWCAALVPATATLRRGWTKAVQFYLASIARGPWWKGMLALAIAGCGTIWTTWWLLPGPRWEALFTSVIGLVFGGALIWAVRIIGTMALREEAMGFGDVTLMGMIGSFLGWQPALIVFFLSPAAALFVAVAQWVATGRRDIAFGPYLCVAAVFLLVRWQDVWDFAAGIFGMGTLVLAILAVCLMLMMGLLMVLRILRQLLQR
jgi:prepilin signal peptidase PulO-like enzyme (type II secretory pathway)